MDETIIEMEPLNATSAELTRNNPATELPLTVINHSTTKSRQCCYFHIAKDLVKYEVIWCLMVLLPRHGLQKLCEESHSSSNTYSIRHSLSCKLSALFTVKGLTNNPII